MAFQIADGRWKDVVYVPISKGKKKRVEFYGRTRQEVLQKSTELRYQIQNNIYVNPGKATVNDFLDEWVKTYCSEKNKNLAPTTRSLYKYYVEKHIKPEFEGMMLKELLPIHIQTFINNKAHLKGKTICKLITVLNKAFNVAISNRFILVNPCEGIDRPKREKYTPKVYTEKQMFQLLDAVKGTFDEVCIVLAGYMGLRRGEIFGLRWKDIDFENRTITISETIVRFDKYIVKGPKSESGNRTIKGPQFVFDILKNYKDRKKIIDIKGNDRVCDKYKPDAYSKHFKKLLQQLNLPEIRLHDCRHYNGTIMMKYHIQDTSAAKRLGHSDVSTTKLYQHPQADMDEVAASVLEEVYKNSGE